jgi:predicted GNAT family acetyltransferase
MEARVHSTVEAFRELASPFLATDPVRHTVLLTAVDNSADDSLMITVHDDGHLVGLAVQKPPYPLITTAVPANAIQLVAEVVHAQKPDLHAASGAVDRIEAFVTAWTTLTNASAERVFGLRMFRLGELKTPTVDGTPRPIVESDMPLLVKWMDAFAKDSELRSPEPPNITAGRLFAPGRAALIWEDDNKPVALAGAMGPFSGMIRVAPVYTPPEARGHGYASGATAAITQWAIDQGADHILLFTDLANETVNRIYPRLGYEPLGDSAEYAFSY